MDIQVHRNATPKRLESREPTTSSQTKSNCVNNTTTMSLNSETRWCKTTASTIWPRSHYAFCKRCLTNATACQSLIKLAAGAWRTETSCTIQNHTEMPLNYLQRHFTRTSWDETIHKLWLQRRQWPKNRVTKLKADAKVTPSAASKTTLSRSPQVELIAKSLRQCPHGRPNKAIIEQIGQQKTYKQNFCEENKVRRLSALASANTIN